MPKDTEKIPTASASPVLLYNPFDSNSNSVTLNFSEVGNGIG